MKTQAFKLKAGDFVIEAQATVKAVDHFGPLVIVDFTDGTATPPVPAGSLVTVRK